MKVGDTLVVWVHVHKYTCVCQEISGQEETHGDEGVKKESGTK